MGYMRKKTGYEVLLWVAYFGMVAVCVYLNIFSFQREGLANLIVNIVMFLIVGYIFLSCERQCFTPSSRMIKDLERVTEKIRQDAMHSHRFLWEQYREEKEELFTEAVLLNAYRDHQYEMDRIERSDRHSFRCDIESYINGNLVDRVMQRNKMSQVAGVMTGLGILGTFIGLSLGLQGFNTGTTAEITNSIEPLMNGIKVAFHTSIYGMVFSLVFNYVYRKRTGDLEDAVEDFLSAFKKYVLPDNETEGVNRIMELERAQTEAIKDLSYTMAHELSDGLTELLNPQFDRFDRTITDFGNMATKGQMEALSRVVEAFLKEMDRAMDHSFSKLSETIKHILLISQENEKEVEAAYSRTRSTAENIASISRESGAIVGALDRYAADVQGIQSELRKTLAAIREQYEGSRGVSEAQTEQIKELKSWKTAMDSSAELLKRQLNEQAGLLQKLEEAIDGVPKNVDHTFRIINENLQDVERHFQKSVLDVKDALEKVPEAVEYTYGSLERSFDRAAKAAEDLAAAVENSRDRFRR